MHLSEEEECTPCEPGHYCASTGLDAATGPCLAGYYCISGSSSNAPAALSCTGTALPIPESCSGTATDTTLTCDLDAGTDSSAACPAGCDHEAEYIPACDLDASTDSTDACPIGCASAGSSICPAGHWCGNGTLTPAACPAGTLYRNYFATKGSNGQINCLSDVEALLAQPKKKTCPYWTIKNGYCLPNSKESMASLNAKLIEDKNLINDLRDRLKVGIHWSTEVTVKTSAPHRVCQVYASACPVAYARNTKSKDWKPFASLVLDSLYESTLAASALLALERNERVSVYLTSVGGGAFGNSKQWISSAVLRALSLLRDFPLDVYMVNYGSTVDQFNKDLVRDWKKLNGKKGSKKERLI